MGPVLLLSPGAEFCRTPSFASTVWIIFLETHGSTLAPEPLSFLHIDTNSVLIAADYFGCGLILPKLLWASVLLSTPAHKGLPQSKEEVSNIVGYGHGYIYLIFCFMFH